MINNNKHRCHQEKHSKYTKETDKLEEAFKALFPQEDAVFSGHGQCHQGRALSSASPANLRGFQFVTTA
jgi:hypothetical protein